MAATEPKRFYEEFTPPERLTLLLEAMARSDEKEAQRLQRTCPRVTYTGQDVEFADRWTMAFDILAVVAIDLRCMWGKLHVLQWVLENTRVIATSHHITATLAFVEGERCGRGLPQCEFFARPLPEPDADGDEELVLPDDEEDANDDDENDDEVPDPTPEQVDQGRRMHDVERRAEHFTACGTVLLLKAMDGVAKDMVNTWAAFDRFCRSRLGVTAETMLKAWEFPLEEFQETLKRYEKTTPDPARVKEYFGYITKQWDERFNHRSSEYIDYGDAGGGGGLSRG